MGHSSRKSFREGFRKLRKITVWTGLDGFQFSDRLANQIFECREEKRHNLVRYRKRRQARVHDNNKHEK